MAQPRRSALSRVRPSLFVLLTALPFVIYLFVASDNYRRAFAFIFPGLQVTVLVTLIAYVAAAFLGLLLAGLLLMKQGKRTLLIYSLMSLALLLVAGFLYTRPLRSFSLMGAPEGRVAIVSGTPARLSETVRTGTYVGVEGEPRPLTVRAAETVEVALERLETGTVNAAFIPSEQVPPGANVLWEVSFLPDNIRNPATAALAFGILTLLLTFGAWQSGHHPLAILAELYVDVIRGIPMLVIILYVGFPLQGAIREMTGGFIDMSRVTRGAVGISLGYAAYMAEIFRAGIEAIPKGQTEAARSLGLSAWQNARYIIMPQAIRIVIPPLGNEFIAMLKDTSLLSVLSIRDITQRAREFQASTFQVFPPFNTAAILYIGLTLVASSLVKTFERRMKR